MRIKQYLINENLNVLEALKRLDEIEKKILFVVRDDVLVGSVTDGDIRRWILKNGDLKVEIINVANNSPKYILEEEINNATEIMRANFIHSIPVVDKENKIIDILFDDEDISLSKKQINLPVVMMAGGKGTRLYPYTKILPKPLIPIGEIPIAEHIINQFREYGSQEFHLVVNHKKNMIKSYFNELKKDYIVEYVDEDVPLGTGGGLSLLKGKIKETFILSNCDILIQEDFSEIYDFHKKNNNIITMVCALQDIQIQYGVVNISEGGKIESMEEKPRLSFLTNTGCYIVEPRVIEELEENTAIGFPDIIEKYKKLGENVGAFPISSNDWLDMGQIEELEIMRERIENSEIRK